MKLRTLGAAACALLLCAAQDAPPLPEALKPYVKDGRLEPGDYGWLRGGFADSTAAENAAFAELVQWSNKCVDDARDALRERLAAKGFADAQIGRLMTGPLLCRQVGSSWRLVQSGSWTAFQEALGRARPVADAYVMAVDIAVKHGRPMGPDFGDALAARPLGEQILRAGAFWGAGELAAAPPLPPLEKDIFAARIGMATLARDEENTAWLKRVLADRGWPTLAEVGEGGSMAAWLLVQHADADPEFQLESLRRMEPLVATGGVTRQNYAYLYDRVMLKLAGKQRYATQAMCGEGKLVSQPVEDPAAVARLRAEMGLEPVEKYLADMNRDFGGCGVRAGS